MQAGILIDVGGTTTDLLPFDRGHGLALGGDDLARMQNGELLYSGVVRTPVHALASALPWRGAWQPIVPERFADMADVYRLLDRLQAHQDVLDTADGCARDAAHGARRLARMIGTDFDAADALHEWQAAARYLEEAPTAGRYTRLLRVCFHATRNCMAPPWWRRVRVPSWPSGWLPRLGMVFVAAVEFAGCAGDTACAGRHLRQRAGAGAPCPATTSMKIETLPYQRAADALYAAIAAEPWSVFLDSAGTGTDVLACRPRLRLRSNNGAHHLEDASGHVVDDDADPLRPAAARAQAAAGRRYRQRDRVPGRRPGLPGLRPGPLYRTAAHPPCNLTSRCRKQPSASMTGPWSSITPTRAVGW